MRSDATVSRAGIWDRLWCNVPTPEKDRQILARERRGIRWIRFKEALVSEFGQVAGLEVVELGSGRGDMSLLLAQCGARATLVDSSDKVLRQAKSRFENLGLNAEYVQADLLSLPESLTRRFDLSLSLGVAEHFSGQERLRAIAAHSRVLKNGGMTLISVPHAACVSYRLWKAYLELRRWWPYGTEIPFWKGELRRHARNAGLAPVELYAYGWWQSVGDHWGRNIFHAECDWSDKRSMLDNSLGAVLVMLARNAGQ